MLKNFFKLAYIANYKILEIFIIGFIGAVPIAFLSLNMIVWLKEAGVEIAVITLFTFTKLPGSLRFIWSPFVDRYSHKFLVTWGHRRKWFILCSFIMSILLFVISTIIPPDSLKSLFILCVTLAFISSIYDINFDAHRIDIFAAKEQPIGCGAAILGYRTSIIFTNSVGLSIASYTGSWLMTIRILSLFFISSVFAMLMLLPNDDIQYKHSKTNDNSLKRVILEPFKDFFKKKDAILILTAVILYKAGESLSTVITLPYYLDIGFSKNQISEAVSIYGFAFSIIGVCLGVVVAYRLGPIRGLIFSGIVQLSMILTLLWLKQAGVEMQALRLVIANENLCEGMASIALMDYLSAICSKNHIATQYALMVSASGILGNTICSYSGKLVEILDWQGFFILAIIVSLPSLIILIYLNQRKTTAL